MTERRKVVQEASPVADLPLHVKYRPDTLKDVYGQDEIVAALKDNLKKETRPHSYLLTGPSGCGKTTLARIIASHVGCDPSNIIEADAATNNGIEDMRQITSTLHYTGFGDKPNKMVILDECHALSKNAWQSLLKSIEEPPPHVFFALCTTEAGKVPETIRTRCLSFNLKPVGYDDICDLLDQVVADEGIQTPDWMVGAVARACNGSPRQALVMLSLVMGCTSREEAHRLLETAGEDKELIDLCRQLVRGDLKWDKLVQTLKALPDQNAESIRIVTVNYLNACLLGAKSEKDVVRLLDLLGCFIRPCNPSDKLAPILLAFGNYIYPV